MWQTLGFLRSLLMFYAIPGRHGRLCHLYSQFIKPGDLCFDIGAHVGNRSRAWINLGANIVALEPQPHFARWLQIIFRNQPRFTLLPTAAGAQPGTATLHISRLTPTVSSLSAEWMTAVKKDPSFARVNWDLDITVPIVTLDELIERYGRPAFCKIDVEGYELEVLKGLNQPLPALSFEVVAAAEDLALASLQQLSKLGSYRYNYSAGESHHLQHKKWLSPDRMADFLNKLTSGSGDVYGRLHENR